MTLIILVISMAATFIPCCKSDACKDEIGNSSQDKKEQKGTCSPFSVCPACAGAVLITKTMQLSSPEISNDQLSEIETVSILLSYSSSFWQPPRTELRS